MNVSLDRLEESTRADFDVRAALLGGSADGEEERTLLGIRQARDLVLGKNRELIDKLAQAEDQIAELTYQRDDFMVARDVALRKAADSATEVARWRSEVATLGEQLAALAEAEKIYVFARSEIETDLLVLAQERDAAVETARCQTLEIEQLAAERDSWQQQAAKANAAFEAQLAAAPTNRLEILAPPPTVTSATLLSDPEMRDAIGSLHLQFEAWRALPASAGLLAEFEAALQSLAERTFDCGFDLIHHLTTSGHELARRLRTTPARGPSLVPVFENAIEMLGWLGLRGRAEMLDLRGALVYAVDDDVDNCECLATAFEKVALQTKYSVRPEIAIEQIAAHACELIVLDVDLPGMDGFQLHSRIRQMPAHAATPIIFLSGHLSTGERLKTLGASQHHFVAKPYNLSELSLRVLTLIVEARLG